MSKEIFLEGIGKVIISKKKGVKRMTLSVRPFRSVRLTIPYYLSYTAGAKFVQEKKGWIIKSKEKISLTENKQTIFNTDSDFKTRERKLRFEQSDKDQIRITGNSIVIYFIDEKEILSDEFQEFIRKAIIETLRIEAKSYLPQRTLYWAEKLGFKFTKVTVRNAKTRWGSCSGKNNISLNIHLMRLPDHLIDYVIQHELCHTIEKNHGPQFWSKLNIINQDAKILDRKLKSYSPEIF